MSKSSREQRDKSSSHEPPIKKSKYSLPTLDEQSQLNTTELLFSTNLLHLQVNELLDEVRCNKKPTSTQRVNNLIDFIKETFLQSANQEISSKWLKKNHVEGIHLFQYHSSEVALSFQSPVSVEVIGSYSCQTITSPYYNIDLMVTMNKNCFDERDILNYTYFDKRTLYLAVLYKRLKDIQPKHTELGDIGFSYFKGDNKKPIVIIRPDLVGWKGLEIRILLTIPSTTFKIIQLNLTKNNVRPKEWLNTLKHASDTTNTHLDASQLQPTPLYNYAIAEDIAIQTQHKIISSVGSISPVIKQTIILCKIWLTQRQYRYSLNMLDSHSVTLLICYLFQTKRITGSMSVVTAFQVVMKFIADLSYPVILNFNTSDIIQSDNRNDVQNSVILHHPLGSKDKFIEYNAFWRISTSCWITLQLDAKSTLHYIQSFDNESTFKRLFLSKISILDREDILFHITIPTSVAMSMTLDNISIDEPLWSYLSHHIYSDLKLALNDRIVSLHVLLTPKDQNDNNKSDDNLDISSANQYCRCHPAINSTQHFIITIGVTLSPDKASRKVDRGPTYEQTEELQMFRDFWGSKCQLRRFQDGSIVEAVVWEGFSWIHPNISNIHQNRKGSMIVGEIVRYILSKNYSTIVGRNGENISSKCLELEETQQFQSYPTQTIVSNNHNSMIENYHVDITLSCKKVVEALDSLRTLLSSRITGMPIMIESLQGIDPELRYTSTYAPLPHPLLLIDRSDPIQMRSIQGKKLSLLVKPIRILGTLESSGKWPTNIQAIQKLKSGILLKVYELLKEQHQISSVVHEDSIDIIFQGYIFRMLLMSDKENIQYMSYTPSRPILSHQHPSLITHMTIHHQAIRTLVATYPYYDDTVRYTMIWLEQSCLTGLLSQSVIELITALVFIEPFPKENPPTSVTTAFLNVLRLISSHDWKTCPMILNLDKSITSVDRITIYRSFQAYRDRCSSSGIMKLPIYIVSSYDRSRDFNPILWDYELTGPELSIIVKCANQSHLFLEQILLESMSIEMNDNSSISQLYRISERFVMGKCNVILKFVSDITKLHQSTTGMVPSYAMIQTFKNTPMKNLSTHNLIVRWSSSKIFPIQEEIVETLRKRFGYYALFFWNGSKGEEIGLTWKPSVFLSKKLSIMESSLLQPIGMTELSLMKKDLGLTIPNTMELLANIVSCCEGYLTSFELV